MAGLSQIRVDDAGILASSRDEVVLDVLLDGRRVWSFWLRRDGESHGGGSFVAWPPALRRFLQGTTRLQLVEHVSGAVLHDEELTLGEPGDDRRIAVEDAGGTPLGLDKDNRLSRTFDTRSEEHVAPLLDAVEEVLGALHAAGVEAFPAYGTLLGAVRGGKLIGHDSDADIGYVSRHSHPVDVIRESFRLQSRLADMGYPISRYSGAAFKVEVVEGDGAVRGLDVFGGFLMDGHLVLMGEIRQPFEREWVFPLGTTTLEGRTLPAPADTDRFLSATYGPDWRVPDPAFHFETPRSTHRRLNGWFRGTRVQRVEWDRSWSRKAPEVPAKPTPVARAVHEQNPDAKLVVDVGCGRGHDAYWLATQGMPTVGLDFSPKAYAATAARARAEGLPLDFHEFNLIELRHALGWGARLARTPGPKAVLARHVADATTGRGRQHLWRFSEMVLRDGGRLHLEFLLPQNENDRFARASHLRTLPMEKVAAELEARGGEVVRARELTIEPSGAPDPSGGRTGPRVLCRMVVQWQA